MSDEDLLRFGKAVAGRMHDFNWRNCFVILEAYLDESGIHEGAEVCVVGGFYGSQPAWRKFEGQWNKIIAECPELAEGFHAQRFFTRADGKRVSPYADWSDQKADRFLNRLVQCIIGKFDPGQQRTEFLVPWTTSSLIQEHTIGTEDSNFCSGIQKSGAYQPD